MRTCALVTGASSGLGRDIAIELSNRGYDLYLCGRSADSLEDLAGQISTDVKIFICDMRNREEVLKLYQDARARAEILINCAGFGLFGDFLDIPLESELELMAVNMAAPHMLTKWFLRDFAERNRGHILNICSAAAYAPGPRMAAYYASKAYLLSLTEALAEELRRQGSLVKLTAVCPGPIKTDFQNRAHLRFAIPSLKSEEVARLTVDAMERGRVVKNIGGFARAGIALTRLLPKSWVRRAAYHLQSGEE